MFKVPAITMKPMSQETQEANRLPIPQALYQLFLAKIDCDVSFIIQKKEIQAHKFILTLRCPGLKAMISNTIAYDPTDGKIHIHDPAVTHDDFYAFLTFLYSDQCDFNEINTESLLHLGDMYDMPLMLDRCSMYVETILNSANIFDWAEKGLIYVNRCDLLNRCLKHMPSKYFINHGELSTVAWLRVSPELIAVIAEKCKRIGEFTEDKFLKEVLDWAKKRCENACIDITPKHIKGHLCDVLPFIRFESLSSMALSSYVADFELIPMEENFRLLCNAVMSENRGSRPDSLRISNGNRGGYHVPQLARAHRRRQYPRSPEEIDPRMLVNLFDSDY